MKELIHLLQDLAGQVPEHNHAAIRRHIQYLSRFEEGLREHEEHGSNWLRDGCWSVHSKAASAKSLYKLVLVVLFSGLLKDATTLGESIQMALQITLPTALSSELIAALRTNRSLPAPSTVYRHRATLYWSFCLMQRKWYSEAFGSGGGVLQWMMVDSSPQGHLDYLLCAHSAIKASDAVQAFDDFLFLARHCALTREDHRPLVQDETALQARFERLGSLAFRPGLPTAVGSGRASGKYKLHALLHSLRMETNSWEELIHLLHNTISITTDLGAESSLPSFPLVAVRDMFPWAEAEGLNFEFGSLAEPPVMPVQGHDDDVDEHDVFDFCQVGQDAGVVLAQKSQHMISPQADVKTTMPTLEDLDFVPVTVSAASQVTAHLSSGPVAATALDDDADGDGFQFSAIGSTLQEQISGLEGRVPCSAESP
eukprot:4972136-Amphidinium_carterae.1